MGRGRSEPGFPRVRARPGVGIKDPGLGNPLSALGLRQWASDLT